MFYGSDTHAEAAVAIFSVIASCRLYRLDPYRYLEEILRVLPYWPRDRHLELAPKYWHATRGRLRPKELLVHSLRSRCRPRMVTPLNPARRRRIASVLRRLEAITYFCENSVAVRDWAVGKLDEIPADALPKVRAGGD